MQSSGHFFAPIHLTPDDDEQKKNFKTCPFEGSLHPDIVSSDCPINHKLDFSTVNIVAPNHVKHTHARAPEKKTTYGTIEKFRVLNTSGNAH